MLILLLKLSVLFSMWARKRKLVIKNSLFQVNPFRYICVLLSLKFYSCTFFSFSKLTTLFSPNVIFFSERS